MSGFEENSQLSFFEEKQDNMDEIMHTIRQKYGHNKIVRGNALLDTKISTALDREQLDKKSEEDK